MEKIKVNKIRDPLDIKELVDKYKLELELGEITHEILENLVSTVLDEESNNYSEYVNRIYQIFSTVNVILKYGDYTEIGYLVRNIVYLQNDYNFKTYDLDKLCNEAYDLLYKHDLVLYGDNIPKELPELFKKEHVLDLEYYMKLFKENCSKDNIELFNIIDKEIWRYI